MAIGPDSLRDNRSENTIQAQGQRNVHELLRFINGDAAYAYDWPPLFCVLIRTI